MSLRFVLVVFLVLFDLDIHLDFLLQLEPVSVLGLVGTLELELGVADGFP
jgi:hypothetical protein